MDRLPAVSDTKASSKCIGTRLAKFRFRGEWNGYWLYQIQKYQVNVSGTNEYQYPHVSDTAKTCINPSLEGKMNFTGLYQFDSEPLIVLRLHKNQENVQQPVRPQQADRIDRSSLIKMNVDPHVRE
ncbi:hypothetical protein AVEN_68610-1 [Araneus ventricosus]|uniref:Uncharacterized protein n=1 Tax=Araneus ventricosus TaxID=182803 RepID=A0A4Y2PU31_ARAVE|nr:hypothetical protein AVEN_68610-1 [Araneus ventricosus]